MRKNLRCTMCACAIILLSATFSHAQIKGNPEFKGIPPATVVQKESSRVSPALKKIYNDFAASDKKADSKTTPGIPAGSLEKYIQRRGDDVVVDITVKEDMATAKAALQKAGLKITGVFGHVISGLMPVSGLPQLESISAIKFAKPAYKPMHQTTGLSECSPSLFGNKATPVISQGDTAQGSYLARKKYNVTGKGVTVGIMSDSYNDLGSADLGVLHGELPGADNPFHFKKPVQVLEDYSANGTDEGRAMAEIVHDVAPGAELAFHTAFLGEADFAQGIQDLADKGCKVIADDVFYFDEPFFQDGIIAQSVNLVKKRGVTYFSSAGNQGVNSYENNYRPTNIELLGPGAGTAHNFSATGAVPRYYQPSYVPGGGSMIASFQWDQSSFSASGVGSETDLDIYLLDIYGNVVAGSASDNILSGDPVEIFDYFNNTPNYTFFLVILKYAGPDVSRLKYTFFDNAQFYLTDPAIPGILSPTLTGHAKAEGAIATGAAFYLNTPAYGLSIPSIDYYSSAGGVANYFDAEGNRISPVTLQKPEIVAPDGGNTSFFDPFGGGDIGQDADAFPNFFGTSAAAPHAAGVAALMIEAQKFNSLRPAQIKGILSSHTVDMDDPNTNGFDKGFDFGTGSGLIKAEEAVGEVKFPNRYIKDLHLKAACSENPSATRSWKINNPNSFEMEAHWLLTGSSQHGSFTVPPGEFAFSTNTFYYRNNAVPNVVIIDWEDNFGFTRIDIQNSSKSKCSNDAADARVAAQEDATEANIKPQIVEVWPNPSTATFRLYLSLADQQEVGIQLYSADGKKLLEKRIAQTKGIISLDASSYKPGIYLLNVKQGGFSKTIKLIKQ